MDIHASLNYLDFAVIGLYILALLSLGFWVSLKKDHEEDLFLAGRSLGWLNIGLSIFGTNVSPSMIIVALFTQPDSKSFPTLKETLAAVNTKTKDIWLMWAGLAVIMLVLYLIFN